MALNDELFQSALRVCRVERTSSWESYGFHLSKGKLETYPRVSRVDPSTAASGAGIRDGDYLVAVNGKPVLGEKIAQIATRIRNAGNKLELLLWTPGELEQCNNGSHKVPGTAFNVDKVSSCLRSLLSLLDCPVCLETITPPAFQCLHGHLLCRRCRTRTSRCPVCRDSFSRARPILADQLYSTLMETFLPKPVIQTPPKTKRSFFVSVLPVRAVAAFVGLPQSLDLSFGKKRITPTDLLEATSRTTVDLTVQPEQIQSPDQILESPSNNKMSDQNSIKSEISSLYNCPFSLDCGELLSSNEVFQHIRDNHGGPMIHSYSSKTSFSVPVGSDGILSTLPTCFFLGDCAFFLQNFNFDDKTYFWLWIIGEGETEHWQAKLQIPINDNSAVNTFHLPIFSLAVPKDFIINSSSAMYLTKEQLDLNVNSKSNNLLNFDVQIFQEEGNVASTSDQEIEITQL